MSTSEIGSLGSTSKKLDDWDRATANVSKGLQGAESNLMKAFSAKEGSKEAAALAKSLGAPAGTSVEGLQILAKNAYDRMSRSFALISQMMQSMHEQMMRVINNIRA